MPIDIGILYPRLRKRDQTAMERLCAGLQQFGAVRLAGDKGDGRPADTGIKITTIHSAKGLQFRAVILMWAYCGATVLQASVQDNATTAASGLT
jgi:ATP-dependent exoDNAse (exonuclease V) beta subunit